MRVTFILFIILSIFQVSAQKAGLIYKPAGNALGKSVLDPNGDGYTSLTSAGFSGTDFGSNSELNMVPLPIIGTEPVGDLTTGGSGGATDIVSVGSNTNQSCYLLYKTVNGVNYLIFRFRLGGASTASKGYSVLFDTDGTFGTLNGSNPGYEKEVVMNTGSNGGVVINTFGANGSISATTSFSIDDYSQRSVALSTISGNADYFYDFFVPFSSIGISSNVRIAAATINSAGSGISGTKSDYNGVNDGLYGNNDLAISKIIINTFPSTLLTSLTDGASFSNSKSITPVVNDGLRAGETSISGKSSEANGTTITVYKNGASIGTTTTSSNAWTLSGITALAAGDLITAQATATGKDISDVSSTITVLVASICTTQAPTSLLRTNGSQIVTGNWSPVSGSIANNSVEIKLYNQTSSSTFTLLTSAATVYVATNGTWSFTVSATQNEFNNMNIVATATSGCMSGYSLVAAKTASTITASPSLVSTSILASPTVSRSVIVQNNDANAATLKLYIGNTEIAEVANVATTATATISYTGYAEGQVVTARAQNATGFLSNISSTSITVTIADNPSEAPTISGTYIAGSGITVSGKSNEIAGTTITLYKASTTILGTATVDNYGVWSATGLTLATSDVLTAKAKAVGETLSPASSSVTVAASAPSAPAITGAYVANATSVSGTGGLGTVTVYIDGSPIGNTTGASWTLSNIAVGQLYKGGVITAKNLQSGIESVASTGVTITGVNSFLITNTSDGSIGTQVAGTAFPIKIVAKDGSSGTGGTVTTYNSGVVLSSTSNLSNGANPLNLTSGVLASHNVTLTTSGSNNTITAVSVDDPSITGTATVSLINPNTQHKFLLTAPSNITAGSRVAYTVSRQDNFDNLTTVGLLTVYLSANGSTGSFYDASTGGNTITSVNIASNTSSATFWFTGETAANYTVTVSDASVPDGNTGIVDASDNISVTAAAASKYVLSASSTALSSSTISVSAQLADQYNNAVTSSGQTVSWSATSGGSFSNSGTSSTNASGIASINYTVSNVAGTYTITASTSSITGSTSVLVSNTYYWTGTTGNWSDASNWNYNLVPAGSNNIEITTGTPRLDQNFTILSGSSLTISGTGSLIIDPGKTLTIAGTADFGGKNILIKSTSAGTGSIGEITGTLTNATNVTVERYIPHTIGNTNSSRRWRLLTVPLQGVSINAAWQNGATWNGSSTLAQSTGTLIFGRQQGNAGSANSRGFDFWSSIANSSNSIQAYEQAVGQGKWGVVNNTTTATAFNDDQAYLLFVMGPRASSTSTSTTGAATTLVSTGTLKQGTRNIQINGNGSKGYYLLGNPYACNIDFDKILTTNAAIIKPQLWVWDAGSGNFGGYRLIKKIGGSYLEIPSPFTANTGSTSDLVNIQLGQGFFVEPLNTSTATLVINESHKTTSSPAIVNTLFSGASEISNIVVKENNTDSVVSTINDLDGVTQKIKVNLNQLGASQNPYLVDGVVALYNKKYSVLNKDLDDVAKAYNFNENIAIFKNNSYMIVEARPTIKSNDTLFIRIWNLAKQTYQLQLKAENFRSSELKAVLEDTYLKTRTPLSLSEEIVKLNFDVNTIAGSFALDRFRIIFEPIAPNPPVAQNKSVVYTGLNNNISIGAKVGVWESVNWYTAATGGAPLATNSASFIPANKDAGVYDYFAEAVNLNTGYTSAQRVPVTLTIQKAPLTVIANDTTKTFGTALPSPNITIGNYRAIGLLNVDKIDSVVLNYDTYVNTSAIMGVYKGAVIPINIKGKNFNPNNYSITYMPGSVRVVLDLVRFSKENLFSDKSQLLLSWNATSLSNVKYFEIQRSLDGVLFEKIALANALPENNKDFSYKYKDNLPKPGTNYYRVKALDAFGNYGFSDIVKINLDFGAFNMTCYPNPVVGNKFNLSFKLLPIGKYFVSITNIAGKVVYTKEIIHESPSYVYNLQLPNYVAPGMYFISCNKGSLNLLQQSIIIQ